MRKLHLFLLCLAAAFLGQIALAQNINVGGVVTDAATGEGVPFASIQVKGTMSGASADADGNYTISVPKNAILVFSSIGYINQEVAVDGRTIVNVMLAPDAESLAETVVVRAEKNHVRDFFGFDRLKSGTYTTAQIDRMWTVAMMEDFLDWFGRDPRAEAYRHLTWEEEMEESRKAEAEERRPNR